jgi:hypothetical protein
MPVIHLHSHVHQSGSGLCISPAFLKTRYRKNMIQRRIPNPFRNRDYESEVYFK